MHQFRDSFFIIKYTQKYLFSFELIQSLNQIVILISESLCLQITIASLHSQILTFTTFIRKHIHCFTQFIFQMLYLYFKLFNSFS